ncbi:FecR family protein [Sphingopyxis sp. 113P3]|uniref:FecR family protein n=1 Tax=Sphingopyxis sp. (strain 113P3) TaxID=292913 RepID=UPI0006AD302E|nr:FecR domain-containing protein [Sphingopyxis sp. 113P3]ALC12711.1 iron dicitrate transport regulator FecR [Sphingopyxis sp. 113P3]
MRPNSSSDIEARAIDWVIRQRDPAFSDWDGFADWLAENPVHAEVYDAIASLDADLDAMPPASSPQVVWHEVPARRRVPRRAWFGGAVAAALVAVVSLSSFNLLGDANRIETAAGEHRTVTLPDGSKIEINGASVVTLDDDRPRFARLEQGEAMFQVVHRDEDPFVVEAGSAEIVDLGTAFNVVRRNAQTSVAVSEGVVAYNPRRENVRVAAGQGLDAADGAAPKVKNIEATNVGGWRTGLLVYNGTPLADVADDLRRTAGMEVRVAAEARDVPFRGALVIAQDRARTIADLAALSGTRATRQGSGWVLTR